MAVEQPLTNTEGTPPTQTRKHLLRRVLLLAVLFVVVIVAGVAAYFVFKQPPPKPPVQLRQGQAISGQVDRLSDSSTKALANYDVKATDNIDGAYASALALSKRGDQKGSIGKFQEIFQTGKAKYYMYEDYALVQGRAGNSGEAVKAFDKASELLKQDSSVSPEVKASEQRYIKNKAAGFKEEASQS